MKLFYIILLSVFLFKCGSNKNEKSIKNTPISDNTTSDMVVKINNVSDDISDTNYIKKRYYVLNKHDTSLFSCSIIEYKIDKTISIVCKYPFNENENNSTSISDSAKVEFVPNKKLEARLITYDNFIKELRLILNTASKQFDLTRLVTFNFDLICISELTTSLSNQLILKYNKSINNIGISKLKSLLQESQLRADLNSIFKPYSVCINELYIEEYLFFPLKSKYGNFKYQDQSPNGKEKQDEMGMDGSAGFTLKPTY